MDLNGKRVAIVMMSAVGDAVHVLPLVNSLKAAYPGVHLTWIIQPGPHALIIATCPTPNCIYWRTPAIGCLRPISTRGCRWSATSLPDIMPDGRAVLRSRCDPGIA